MLFMSVYTIAMDTLLQCFIVDETNQKAKGKGKPQWAPEDLADLMDISPSFHHIFKQHPASIYQHPPYLTSLRHHMHHLIIHHRNVIVSS